MENNFKEVYYDEFCKKCKFEEREEDEDPCWYCLDEPMNINSHKPLEFREKD